MAHPSDVYPIVESIQQYFFYFVGAFSLLVNLLTLTVILSKTSILEKEIRRLTLYLETSCLLQNFFYTIFFIPFHYPRAGAGYCIGILCGAVPYPILLIIFSILTMNMFAAFGMMIIARHQMMLFHDSKLKMSRRLKTISYAYVFLLFQTVSVVCALTSLAASDKPTQIRVLHNLFPQLEWQQRGLNWYLFNRAGNPTLFDLVNISLGVIIPLACALVVAPFAHMILIVLRSRNRVHTRQDRVHLRSAHTMIIQFTVHVIFFVVPVFIITAVGFSDNIYAGAQTLVCFAESLFAYSTLANSCVVLTRNRAYLSTIESFFRCGVQPAKGVAMHNSNAHLHSRQK